MDPMLRTKISRDWYRVNSRGMESLEIIDSSGNLSFVERFGTAATGWTLSSPYGFGDPRANQIEVLATRRGRKEK